MPFAYVGDARCGQSAPRLCPERTGYHDHPRVPDSPSGRRPLRGAGSGDHRLFARRCLVSIALGFIGALLGMWIARAMSLPEPVPVEIGGASFPVVWSIIGAALFVAIISLISRPRPMM